MRRGEPSFLPCDSRAGYFRQLLLVLFVLGWGTMGIAQGLVEDPPNGRLDGVTVLAPDRAHFQLRAPSKDHVNLRGDFNNWQIDGDFEMNQSIDGSTWWLEVDGLEPGAWIRYHYLIDDTLEVADPYAPVILDPWNDGYIPPETFPNRPPYPSEHAFWPVGAFRTVEPEFQWTDAGFSKPAQDRLVIYELLVRDWDAARDFDAVVERLDHLSWLGITAIELMPVSEFDGNISWGYNPGPRFAVDKAYGTASSLKRLVNEAHARGIAVILDVVPNHSFGLDPLLRMYQTEEGTPASGNPWFNVNQIHPYGLGSDIDHGDPWTREFWKRALDFWIEEFHVDGYRIDLSKGLTQTFTLGDVGAWNAYDQSRVDILFDYGNHVWYNHPGTYMILEHLGDNPEESALANGGFLLWGKSTSAFTEAALGYGGDFSQASWQTRGWNWPNLIAYFESHDEQRIAHDLLLYGNSQGSYDTKSLATAMDRLAMTHAFLFALPGPKMMYQWGEFGYDVSIYDCLNGNYEEGCKLDEKPEPWDDRALVPERQGLARTIKKLCELKRSEPAFGTYDYGIDFGGSGKRLHLYTPNQNVVLAGNFDVVGFDMIPGFPHTGPWTDAITGITLDVSDLSSPYYFAPGQWHLWMDTPVSPVDVSEPLVFELNCTDSNAVNFGAEGSCRYMVTVALDATDLIESGSISPWGLHVAGSFQGWSPSGTDLVEGVDGVWSASFEAAVGDLVEFKFVNGNNWNAAETVPSGCGVSDEFGGYNRQWVVAGADVIGPICFGACAACESNLDYPGCMDSGAINFDSGATLDDGSCQYDVLFQVDVSELTVPPTTVYVAGSFQGWDVAGTPMNDLGNGLWEHLVTVTGSDSIQYKFLSSPDWDAAEVVPMECGIDNGLGGGNRVFLPTGSLTELPVVCFSSCAVCEAPNGGGGDDPIDPVLGSDFCGPGTVWDDVAQLCVGLTTCDEDINGDGLISVSDVLALLSAFGSVCP